MRYIVSGITGFSLAFLLLLGASLGTAQKISAAEDYRGMVERIGVFFDKGLADYKAGRTAEAKAGVQAAYFEVFENLEGPIRINISARQNFILEEEFVGIRKMIVEGAPYGDVEKRVSALMDELNAIVPQLEEGFELVAEQGAVPEPAETTPGITGLGGGKIEPLWQQKVIDIEERLIEAIALYEKGDREKARSIVTKAQFGSYKNSLLETAVRRYVSSAKDYENNAAFADITEMIQAGEPQDAIEGRVVDLLRSLSTDLPGLPLVEGAGSGKVAGNGGGDSVPDKDWGLVTAELFAVIGQAVDRYEAGDRSVASGMIQDSYFDIFEASGMEIRLGTMDPGMKAALEGHFSRMVGQMKKGASADELRTSVDTMRADFNTAVGMLGEKSDSPLAVFFYSLMIILREGFEAILIVTAIISYLIKTGNGDKLKTIYNGCISALVLSVITAVLMKWVFRSSAASQEIMEGFTMLLAAAVLFGMSYWLISKAEAQKWMAYIKGKIDTSLSTGSLWALWFAAFLAVYREGAETILFYQALAVDQTSMGMTAIMAGFGLGCVLLVILYLAMRYGAVKLPIRPFFLATGLLLYYMSFVFVGKGVMELIEGKFFEPSLIGWLPTISWIGVYPYWQAVVPQLFLVLAALVALGVLVKQKKEAYGRYAEESSAA